MGSENQLSEYQFQNIHSCGWIYEVRSRPRRARVWSGGWVIIQMQVQYRNCNYIGGFSQGQYHRQGFGMLLQDNSQVLMAKWKAGQVSGPYLLINDHMRSMGTMLNGKLEGYNVLSMQESLVSNKPDKERTIYGMFRENKLYGKAVIIDDDTLVIAHFTNGELREITDKKPLKDKEVINTLRICFPNEIYNIVDWLTFIFSEATREFNKDGTLKFEPVHTVLADQLNFYGYSDIFNKKRTIGFAMHQGEVISVGEHEGELLEGLGRAYHSDGTVEDGVFKEGELCGIGIIYSKSTHKYILGEHNQENSALEKGFGFPQKQISQIRKQFHLRSIYFYNDIVVLPFSTVFEAILVNCLQLNPQNESPRFTSINHHPGSTDNSRRRGLPEKSPLRAKIIEYELESQRIEEPSPIKNKAINQYERADTRSNKYFDNYEESEGERRSRHNASNSRNGNISGNGNSRIKDSSDRPRRPSESRSGTSQRKIKDTKQLVRQLDEKELRKRSYLDEIYKQAKLYNVRN